MNRNKSRVLVIDDEESMRDSCALILSKEGYEPELAEDGSVGLEKAKDRLEALLQLINDWLDVARLNGREIIEKGKPFPLENLLKKLVDFMQPYAKENDISLELKPISGSASVHGDEERLEQVFSNLINNAINYNKPKGSVTISVKEEKEFMAIEIKDTGIGIAKEHIPLIFDQFYRVSRSESQKHKGTGLGLTIAKKIVDTHGGFIQVSSELGKGSTFTVLLAKAKKGKN